MNGNTHVLPSILYVCAHLIENSTAVADRRHQEYYYAVKRTVVVSWHSIIVCTLQNFGSQCDNFSVKHAFVDK
jgi:hypothetical protein